LPLARNHAERRKHKKSNQGERQLNHAIHCIAISQIGVTRRRRPKNPVARSHYLKKLAEGKNQKASDNLFEKEIL